MNLEIKMGGGGDSETDLNKFFAGGIITMVNSFKKICVGVWDVIEPNIQNEECASTYIFTILSNPLHLEGIHQWA